MTHLTKQSKLYFYLWFGLIGVILALSIYFRGFLLSLVPPILNRDEAALAYNAYLLKETGKDEWGVSWPIAPASFGDYKLIGYPAVLTALFSIFPKHDWIVRLPSMVAGLGIILLAFMIGRKLFDRKWSWAFTALVASTPALLWFSRSAWEANLALCYLIWAGYLIFFHKKAELSILRATSALILIALSLLTYNSPLIIVPCIALLIPFISGRLKLKQALLLTGLVFAVWLTIFVALSPVFKQKSGITIFTDPTIHAQWIEHRLALQPPLDKILGNYPVYILSQISTRTINQFSFDFLVMKGDTHPWHALPGWGHLFAITYIFSMIELAWLVVSLIYDLLKLADRKLTAAEFWSKLRKNYVWLYLIMVSILPSVITVDAPHPTRSLLFFFIMTLLAVRGLHRFTLLIEKQKDLQSIAKFFPIGAMLVVIISLGRYSYQYFTSYPTQAAQTFGATFIDVLSWVEKNRPSSNIAIVDPEGYQYIVLAWYLKLEPNYFLQNNVRQNPTAIGLRYGERVGRYHFIANIEDSSQTEDTIIYFDRYKAEWVVQIKK